MIEMWDRVKRCRSYTTKRQEVARQWDKFGAF